MTERLILFSGGVESTALLTLYQPGDHVMVVEHAHDKTSDPMAPFKILKAMGIENVIKPRFDLGVPTNGPAMYQLHWLLAVAGVFVEKRVRIRQVWYGLHQGEPHEPRTRGEYERLKTMWAAWHPQVSLVSPFIHLTKDWQWDLIPDEVRPLVRNCLTLNDCGTCRKCLELKALPGSFWSTR